MTDMESGYYNKSNGEQSVFQRGWDWVKDTYSDVSGWVSRHYADMGIGLNHVQNNVRDWMTNDPDSTLKQIAGFVGVQALNVVKAGYGFLGLAVGGTERGVKAAADVTNEHLVKPVQEKLGKPKEEDVYADTSQSRSEEYIAQRPVRQEFVEPVSPETVPDVREPSSERTR